MTFYRERGTKSSIFSLKIIQMKNSFLATTVLLVIFLVLGNQVQAQSPCEATEPSYRYVALDATLDNYNGASSSWRMPANYGWTTAVVKMKELFPAGTGFERVSSDDYYQVTGGMTHSYEQGFFIATLPSGARVLVRLQKSTKATLTRDCYHYAVKATFGTAKPKK